MTDSAFRPEIEKIADKILTNAHKAGVMLASPIQPHPRDFGAQPIKWANGWQWVIENPAHREEYWKQLYFWAMRVYAANSDDIP